MLAVLVRRGVADRVGQVDRRRAGPDRGLDAAAEVVDRRCGSRPSPTIRRRRRGCAPASPSRSMISSTSSSALSHLDARDGSARWRRRCGCAAALAPAHRLAGAGDVGGDGAREARDGRVLRRASAISATASKSPFEAIGKPASMMSTPIASSSSATSSFSSSVMVAPGHCSPSRRVVSKIRTRSLLEPVTGVASSVSILLAGARRRGARALVPVANP